MNTVIHAAVRRDIARLGHALDALPVGSRERAAELDAAWRHLDGQLYHHHHGEETIFWPALRELGADESLVGDLGGEHERMAEAMTRTRVAMAAMSADPSEERIAEASVSPVRETDGTITGYVAVERDVTPERALQAERETLEERWLELAETAES